MTLDPVEETCLRRLFIRSHTHGGMIGVWMMSPNTVRAHLPYVLKTQSWVYVDAYLLKIRIIIGFTWCFFGVGAELPSPLPHHP